MALRAEAFMDLSSSDSAIARASSANDIALSGEILKYPRLSFMRRSNFFFFVTLFSASSIETRSSDISLLIFFSRLYNRLNGRLLQTG